MKGRIEIKVYYEDTDCLGIVYYANYLRYLERGRTELIEATGMSVAEWNKQGYNFAIYQLQMKFLKPARLGDRCQVVTETEDWDSSYRKKLRQWIELKGQVINEAKVELVCLDAGLQLREFPAKFLV